MKKPSKADIKMLKKACQIEEKVLIGKILI